MIKLNWEDIERRYNRMPTKNNRGLDLDGDFYCADYNKNWIKLNQPSTVTCTLDTADILGFKFGSAESHSEYHEDDYCVYNGQYYKCLGDTTKYTPVRIISNFPVTVVFWKDGTKTIVRCAKGDEYSVYSAFTAALAKKIFGSNSKLKKTIEKVTVVPKPKKKKKIENVGEGD